MRALALVISLAFRTLAAQTAPATTSSQAALSTALLGRWTSVLEYRDYSETPSSTKRIQLPTWLTIAPASEGLSLDYVYDDGPAETVNQPQHPRPQSRYGALQSRYHGQRS